MATDSECVTLILQKLFIIEGSEAADSSDSTLTTTVFDSRIEFLRDEGVCWWADDAIPSQCLDPLADYVAFYVPVLPINERMPYKGPSVEGLMTLRKLAAKASEGNPTRAEYF